MTSTEIYAIQPDEYGWRKLPNGNWVKLGNDVTLGDKVKLGNDVTLGNWVKLGDDVTLGNCVKLGDDVTLGNWVKLGDDVTLGDKVKLGNDVTLGNWVKLGNDVTLGDKVKLGNDVTLGDGVTSEQINLDRISALAVIGQPLLYWKWVTKDRKSPNFDGGTVIEYQKGAIVEAEGEVSDKQCAPGLHVVPVGVRPEWIGMCEAGHPYIPLLVRVEPSDLLHAGMPGNDSKLRVRKLEVLT